MSAQSDSLKQRTRAFAHACLDVIERLPPGVASRVISFQLAKSATSADANYRAACLGRSRADFIAKLGLVLEETDESQGWLEIIAERKMVPDGQVLPVLNEATELRSIFGRSYGTARSNRAARSRRSFSYTPPQRDSK
jgi:four helix bundle protein